MTPVSSVTAFLGRHALGDAEARQLLAAMDLDPDARLVAEAQAIPAAERLQWMRTKTQREWSSAGLAHAEARAFAAIRRELQARNLYR